MEKYLSQDHIKAEITPSQEFSEIEFEALLISVEEQKSPVVFEIEKGGSVASSPETDGKRIYFGAMDGIVYCLDAETGQELWRFEIGYPVSCNLTLLEDRLLIGAYDENVYCLSLNGKLLWKQNAEGKVAAVGPVWNNRFYFGSESGNLYCLDVKTGRELWRFRTQGPIAFIPLLYKNRLFFGSFDYCFYCLDPETGELLWKIKTGQEVIFNAVAQDERIYFASFDCYLYCCGLNGRILWRTRIPKQPNTILVLAEGKLITGSRDYNVYCLDADTGRILWVYHTGALLGGGISYKDGLLMIGGDDNLLHVLDLMAG